MSKKNANVKANGTSEIEMIDGTVLPLIITWGLLLQVRSMSKSLYHKFSKLVNGDIKDDVLGALSIVYCGYLCAYIAENGSSAGSLSEDEFIACAPDDINLVVNVAMELIAPKASRDFKKRLSGEQTS